MEFKDKNIYDKAIRRMKIQGIIDPTNIIINLEKEIDYYRDKIKVYNDNCKKATKEGYIHDAVGKINYNIGTITSEDKDLIYVSTDFGTSVYSKLQLAIFWLQHSNDCFYETFGFNWVPESYLQEKARKIINDGLSKKIESKVNIQIGIDGIDALRYAMQNHITGFRN